MQIHGSGGRPPTSGQDDDGIKRVYNPERRRFIKRGASVGSATVAAVWLVPKVESYASTGSGGSPSDDSLSYVAIAYKKLVNGKWKTFTIKFEYDDKEDKIVCDAGKSYPGIATCDTTYFEKAPQGSCSDWTGAAVSEKSTKSIIITVPSTLKLEKVVVKCGGGKGQTGGPCKTVNRVAARTNPGLTPEQYRFTGCRTTP